MVRVAVVGAGFWGVNHVRVLKELPGVEVVGVCDVDFGRVSRAGKRFGVEHLFTDSMEMIEKTRPDAVSICTPSTTHASLALQMLDAGCDVLIEKPMASTVSEAVQIIDKMLERKRRVMVGFIERFNPAVQFAKKIIDEGEIGDVLLFFGRRIGSWPERVGDVGVVKDTAVHDIDLVTWVFGGLPESVYAMCGRLRHSYEDHAQIFLSYSGTRSALLEANWLTPRKKREMQITGEKGVVSVRFIEQEVVLEKAEQLVIPNLKYSEPLKNELAHFVECVEKGAEPAVNVYDGLRATLLAECILESARRKKPVNPWEIISEHHVEEYVGKGLGAARI
ncbi:MAG: Gfo/Idh/MocA family oxidoreductase [Candidatus Caldarchaeum sp.]|nr:Gfo/Idh/MocA family oxidoreductase [Candidatus Caldarchaeum sp.]